MFDKLKSVEERFEEISLDLTKPETVSDNELFKKLMKEHKQLSPIVEKYREYKATKQAIEDALSLLEDSSADDELKELAQLVVTENK